MLRVITRLNIGGPAIQAVCLSTGLAREGFETLLVYGSLGAGEGDMTYLLPEHGLHSRFVPSLQRRITPWADVKTFFTLLRIIRGLRPHIVHTHTAKAGLIARSAAMLSNRTRPRADRARLVHTYHGHVLEGYFSGPTTRLFIALERLLSRGTDRIIAVSSRVRDELLQRYRIGSSASFRVVPLGLDLEPLGPIDDAARAAARRALDIPSGALVVTTVGRLTAIKNHRLFLDAAQRVASAGREVLFLIAGDGELRGELERDAAGRGLADRVRFLGWRRDLSTIYGATDVFVITSANEGTPVALIEAMAAGVAGVSTDVGGVRDVIVDESMGIVVPSEDTAALTAAIAGLLDDPVRRKRIGASARASALARFTVARLTESIAELYREL